MNRIIKWLALGAAMGTSFAAGFLVAKKKYDALNDIQYQELKVQYEKSSSEPKLEKPEETPNVYTNVVEWLPYVDAQTKSEVESKAEYNYNNMITLITPIAYGEDPTYDNVTLTYYADGVLARDDTDELIDNVDDVIGIDSMKYLGQYENGVLYIKNDIMRTYYEVTESDKTYYEATGYEN